MLHLVYCIKGHVQGYCMLLLSFILGYLMYWPIYILHGTDQILEMLTVSWVRRCVYVLYCMRV